MEKKVYFYVISYYWEGSEELSYYTSPVLYNDKTDFIKCLSDTLYRYTSDPRAKVVGCRTVGYDITDSSFKDHSL